MKNRKKPDSAELLVWKIQHENAYYYEKLEVICKPISMYATNKYYLDAYEKEDLLQETQMVLVQTANDYIFGSGLSYEEYYHMTLSNHMNNLVRKDKAYLRKANKNAYSLDELTEAFGVHIQGEAPADTNPEDIAIVNELYTEYKNSLSELEKEVYSHHREGKTPRDISKSMDSDLKKIRNAIYRCASKLRKKLD